MDPDVDPDPAIFFIDLKNATKKIILKKFFCILFFEGTFFTDKKSKRSHKTVEIKFFLILLPNDRRIRIRFHTSD